ncbi:hypothetical protein [Sphingobacterium hotanense]|uniref:hypothetical protein n=1 Tax=Sphingobacterium hotanense TaxID=649196 RepID=UPI0021A8B63A|nr:hypothetical protein [Sphingobacterium hotanense]MCT1526834.1 hypothetical protein [Sphingobacterium hotanense]
MAILGGSLLTRGYCHRTSGLSWHSSTIMTQVIRGISSTPVGAGLCGIQGYAP